MSAAAIILYVWSMAQDFAVVIISTIALMTIGIVLWYIDVLRKRKNENNL